MEAEQLKSIGGTKLVALGIGSGVDVNELNSMASSPQDRNVFLVRDFGRLSDVEEQLRNSSCSGRYTSLISEYEIPLVIVKK